MKRCVSRRFLWIWCAYICSGTLPCKTPLSAKAYAEAEFWFASVKSRNNCYFLVLAALLCSVLLRLNGKASPIFIILLKCGLFPNGALAASSTMITVNTPPRTGINWNRFRRKLENPEKTIPKAIKTQFGETLFFFALLAIFSCCRFTPWQEAILVESPFVLVFDVAGVTICSRHL